MWLMDKMRVRIEYGDSAGRMDNTILKTKTIEVDNFTNHFRSLKREFIKSNSLTEEEDIDCLNEFSEVCEVLGEFYIGMDEGPYIGGWRLV